MKIKYEFDCKLPDYSLSYLINADDSGLEEDDKQSIDDYMEQYYELAQECNGDVVISVESEEGYFTWNPDFGLACNVYDCKIVILVDEE